jgi:recombination protein RecA
VSGIEDVLAKLDKKTRERAIAASEVKIEFLETPSVALNRALGGGLAYGRQVMLYGNKSCGKTSLALQLIAEAQRNGKSCLWVDAEKTFDPRWAERLGVDVDKLQVIQVSDSMRIVNDTIQFMEAGIDVIVIDSISSMVPMSYFEKDSIDLKGMEATRQIGSSAKDLAEAVRLWNQSNTDTLLILISQVRNKLGAMYVSTEPTGGFAPKFFSTTVIKFWSSESMKNAKEGEVQVGDYVTSEAIGREVTWIIENNKTGKPFQQGQYDFYFDGPDVGVDTTADVLDEAVKFGIIRKAGAWYYYGDLSFQGRGKIVSHFKSLPDDLEVLKKEVMAYGTPASVE